MYVALSDVTAEGVERAIAEFNQLGRRGFLTKYGFGMARVYFLVRDGRRYDSKAIVGAAHGYDFPKIGPLANRQFSGGKTTVVGHLESLGFEVTKIHGDLNWVEEELILALDLYLRAGNLNDNDQDVIELSRVLKGLPFHTERPDPERFRNPSGVARKLANFLALDDNDPREGLPHGSNLDAEVWKRYASDEDALAEVAAAIREGQERPSPGDVIAPPGITTDIEAQHAEQ